jgi:hypothetical protein
MVNVLQIKESVEITFVKKDTFAQMTDAFHAIKSKKINATLISNAKTETHAKTTDASQTNV